MLGPDCHVWPQAVLGTMAQHRDSDPEQELGKLRIGSGNRFREGVTINAGTPAHGGVTTLGNDNLLLAGAHIGHDATVGNNVTMTNVSMAAGHTIIQDRAVIGAMVGMHQFARVGRLAMLAAGAMMPKDAPPYAMVHGDRARIRGVNLIGMRRAGLSQDDISTVKRAYRMLFWRNEVLSDRCDRVEDELGDNHLVAEILTFMRGTSRGVLMARGRSDFDEEREPAGL